MWRESPLQTEQQVRSAPVYPAPPEVHWLVLSLAGSALNWAVEYFAPASFQSLLESLVVDAWAFYLCLWIRKLNPEAKSPFWCDVFVIVELAYAALLIHQNPSFQFHTLTKIMAIASGVLGIATIFLIRSDLQKHYNETETFGLQLGPVMTFFFSFIYFQYHLYDIAVQKRREALETGATYNMGPLG